MKRIITYVVITLIIGAIVVLMQTKGAPYIRDVRNVRKARDLALSKADSLMGVHRSDSITIEELKAELMKFDSLHIEIDERRDSTYTANIVERAAIANADFIDNASAITGFITGDPYGMVD